MNNRKGYLCENCGKMNAQFEARISLKQKSLLLCFPCLEKLKTLLEIQSK